MSWFNFGSGSTKVEEVLDQDINQITDTLYEDLSKRLLGQKFFSVAKTEQKSTTNPSIQITVSWKDFESNKGLLVLIFRPDNQKRPDDRITFVKEYTYVYAPSNLKDKESKLTLHEIIPDKIVSEIVNELAIVRLNEFRIWITHGKRSFGKNNPYFKNFYPDNQMVIYNNTGDSVHYTINVQKDPRRKDSTFCIGEIQINNLDNPADLKKLSVSAKIYTDAELRNRYSGEVTPDTGSEFHKYLETDKDFLVINMPQRVYLTDKRSHDMFSPFDKLKKDLEIPVMLDKRDGFYEILDDVLNNYSLLRFRTYLLDYYNVHKFKEYN